MNRHITGRRADRFAVEVAGTPAVPIERAPAAVPRARRRNEVDPASTIEVDISDTLNGSFDPMVALGAIAVAANWHIFGVSLTTTGHAGPDHDRGAQSALAGRGGAPGLLA